jgi:formate dehydrogenase major subunit
LTMVEQTEAALAGKVKGLVICGTNPIISYPDANRVQKALASLEFLLVMDIFPTATTEMADVVLPDTSFAEADGTFSSSERRVQRVRPVIEPICGRHGWEIIQDLSTRMGYPMKYKNTEEIFNEMAELMPSYHGMSFARLEEKGLCWPCPTPDHPGTPYLHKDKFARGKGMFHAIPYRPPAETPDKEFPFWLTTGTLFNQYLTATMTRRCESLVSERDEVFVEMHKDDAKQLQVRTGDLVQASTRRGSIKGKVLISERMKPGTVFIPMHFLESSANRITSGALDPLTKTPEYKACSVQLQRV